MNECKHCIEKNKTWSKNNDPIECGFKTKEFDPSNWNCGTLGKLRQICDRLNTTIYSEDQWCGVIPYEGLFLVLGWYKSRGRTEELFIVNKDTLKYQEVEPSLLELLEEVIEYYKEQGLL